VLTLTEGVDCPSVKISEISFNRDRLETCEKSINQWVSDILSKAAYN